jgi:hypothetical protein
VTEVDLDRLVIEKQGHGCGSRNNARSAGLAEK